MTGGCGCDIISPLFGIEGQKGSLRMEISVTTCYDYKQLLRFQYYHMLQRKAMWIFIAICDLLLLWLFAAAYLAYGFRTEVLLNLILLLLVWFGVPFSAWAVPRITMKKADTLGAVCNYTFEAEGFRLKSESPQFLEDSFVKYVSIYKVYESRYCFYIYISKFQAYILDKDDFTEGTPEDLRELLRDTTDEKKLKLLKR